jgi:hypothetical protein
VKADFDSLFNKDNCLELYCKSGIPQSNSIPLAIAITKLQYPITTDGEHYYDCLMRPLMVVQMENPFWVQMEDYLNLLNGVHKKAKHEIREVRQEIKGE